MAKVLEFLTFEDIARSNSGCLKGVIEACNKAGVWFCSVDDALVIFKNESDRILKAANADGYGYGDGGDGYGYGYGDGGDGYGYGYGG